MTDTVSNIESTLSTGLSSTIENIGGLTDQQKNTLNTAASTLATSYAPSIVNQVTTTANGTITDLTQNAIGPNNPLDIVNSNLSVTNVTDTLSPVVTAALGPALTTNFVNDLTSLFKTGVGEKQLTNINMSSITDTLNSAVSGLMNTSLGSALDSFSSQLMSGSASVTPFFSSVTNIFASGGSDTALQKIDDVMASSVSNKAIAEAKKFDIKSQDNEEKLASTKRGFIDPTATHPTKEYSGRPETNLLATGDIKGTIVQSKEKERMKGAQLPNGEAWDQPLSCYKGEYPYNKVIQTESGHIIEMDDTPGSERLQIFHRSGTFVEIDSNGSVIKRTKGSSYEIIDKNNYVAINGRTNISVNGACQIFVGADANIEVEGDTNIICKNDITAQAGGRIDLSATEEINLHSKIVRIEADEAMHIVSDGKLNAQSSTFNLLASGDVNIDGSKVYLDSDTAEGADNSTIGLLSGRKTISEVLITDPIATNYTDYSNTIAEDSNDPKLAKENLDKQVRDGVATRDEVSESVVVGETSTPQSSQTDVVYPSTEILKVTSLPDNYQLSKHFTVGMLTNQAVVSKHKLQAQGDLTYGQIAYNLAALALNVLEPIKALYPNMVVTSCFRDVGKNPTSQHPKGMAADIQIPGISKKDYYDVANKLAKVIKYDQFLLEYKTTGTGLPWLHISFNMNSATLNNRLQAMTFLNDRKHSDGFSQLA